MSDLTIALLTIFGTVASVTGVVLYVFNGTRALIKEMHQTQKEMQQTQKEMQQNQQELRELQKEAIELQKIALRILERIEERAEKRHQEVMERLR